MQQNEERFAGPGIRLTSLIDTKIQKSTARIKVAVYTLIFIWGGMQDERGGLLFYLGTFVVED